MKGNPKKSKLCAKVKTNVLSTCYWWIFACFVQIYWLLSLMPEC